LFRGGGKIFARNGAEPVALGADNEAAIGKWAQTPDLPFSLPGWPGLSPARLHAVMHLHIVQADRQLTGRYVANGSHCWAMWIGANSAGGTDQAAGC
jgi:hypothetical protein